MAFDKTVHDIIEYTGLKYEYIIKCIKEIESLKPHIQRGDKNSLVFDSNVLPIFDRIKQLKEGKQSISSIKAQLEIDLSKTEKHEQNTTSNLVKHTQNMNDSDMTKVLLEKLDEANRKSFNSLERVLEAKEQVIEAQKRENQELKTQVLLLTDGKSPEETRLEFQKKEQDLYKLKEEVEKSKREQEEAQKIISEKDKALEEITKREERRKELLAELESLEGKWLKKKQRAKILQELKTLS